MRAFLKRRWLLLLLDERDTACHLHGPAAGTCPRKDLALRDPRDILLQFPVWILLAGVVGLILLLEATRWVARTIGRCRDFSGGAVLPAR